MKPVLLIATNTFIPPDYMEKFHALFTVHYAPSGEAQRAALASGWIGDVQAVFALGSRGVPKVAMDRMPKLEIVVCKGAGYDGFDIDEMVRRGIAGANAADLNAGVVADHALALMLATVRAIPEFDRAVRRGAWTEARIPRPSITGTKLGVLGMGSVGGLVAARAHRGFDMPVSYHNRRPLPQSPFRYFEDPLELARHVDILMLTCPGGGATHHLVGRTMLDAIGPEGFVVNMARGSVVDTDALVHALRERHIAGAGLDVFEGEPAISPALFDLPNLVMTPHVGAFAPEATAAALDLVIANLKAHFAREPLPSPIPGTVRSVA